MTRRSQWVLCLGSLLLTVLGAPLALSLVVREWNGPYIDARSSSGDAAAASSTRTVRSATAGPLLFAGEVVTASATRGG